MSPSKSSLLTNYKCAPRTPNNSVKRSFSHSEYDTSKKKKIDKHSQEDIHNATLSSNGYMTRNRLKKKLMENDENDKSITIKKSFKNKKSNNGKRKRKRVNKKKMQLGYVFTHDIFSSHREKQLFTKNSTPSLFESDSELESDCFQINEAAKSDVQSNNILDIEKINKNDVQSASIPKLEKIYKNGEVKTYFNKKLNKSLNSFSNECENNELSSSVVNILSYAIKNCKERTQVEKLYNTPLGASDPITSNNIEETKNDDDTIIITEEFIRQLEEELKTENKVLKVPVKTQNNSNTNSNNSNVLISEHENIEVMSHTIFDDTMNQSNTCIEDTSINDTYSTKSNSSSCDNYLLQHEKICTNKLVEPELLPFKTSNVIDDNLFSIFDLPEENTLEKSYTGNQNENINSHSDFKTSTNISEEMIKTNEFENSNLDQFDEKYPTYEQSKFTKENNTCSIPKKQNYNLDTSSLVETNQCIIYNSIKDNNKNKSEISVVKTNIDGLMENNNFNLITESSSKNTQLDSKCHCKVFCHFNNKILTSKTNHFAFNYKYRNIRKKFLHQRRWEANILEMLITKDKRNIIQSEMLKQTNTNMIHKTSEKYLDVIESDHIENNKVTIHSDMFQQTSSSNLMNETFVSINDDNMIIEPQNLNRAINKRSEKNQLATLSTKLNNKNHEKYVDIKKNGHIANNKTTIHSNICVQASNSNLNNEKCVNISKDNHVKSQHLNESEKKNDIIQLENRISIENPNLTSNTYEKCVVINDDDHILNKPNCEETVNINFETPITTKDNSIYEKGINKNITEMRNFSKHVSEKKKDKNKRNIQSETLLPIKNLNLISKKNEKCIDINESDHIEPNILSMLKDVYVDIEYLPEYCDYKNNDDKSLKLQPNKDVKNNVQTSGHQLVENKCFTKCSDVISDVVTNKPYSESNTHLDKNNIDKTCHFKVKNKKSNSEVDINLSNISRPNNHTILTNEIGNSNEGYKKYKNNRNEAKNSLLFNSTECDLEFTEIIDGVSRHEITPDSVSLDIETNKNILDLLEPPHYKDLIDKGDTAYISDEDKKLQSYAMPLHLAKQQKESLFNVFNNDIKDSLININSNDDDDDDDDNNRLLIEEDENDVHRDLTFICTSIDSSKDTIITDKLSSVENITNFITGDEFYKNKFNFHSKNKQLTEISIANDDIVLSPEKEHNLSNHNNENMYVTKTEKNSLNECIVMSIEMCNNFYEKKSLNNGIIDNKNEHFSKNINDIFTDMYVDEMFVSLCQHMVELCDDVQLNNDYTVFQIDSNDINMSEKMIYDNNTVNGENKVCSDVCQSIPINTEIIFETEIDYSNQKINEPNKSTNNIQNSSQKPKKLKSNYKIRTHIREFVNSDKTMNDILESKEFRSLKYVDEEEIACTIGVFIFEQVNNPPIITGLLAYKENYEQLHEEEKNKLLSSTNLNISFPEIMKLTSITLALVKMLKSDTLIDLIFNVIRKNLFNKKMNVNHFVDQQLITHTVYFVDICVRLKLLKTLQTFIFDSMVLLPYKCCCIIFTSLLLWKNCLPVRINDKQDPVIITAMSYLIAKRKFYAKQTVGCDIFQRELMNLLSCHFNYSFSTDLPNNFIQHIHKPDFFVSVVMILKCCNPKDFVEFVVNCLFPIIENYLNTQQNKTNACKIMESINLSIKPFKISCNATVATYLKKCRSSIDNSIKDEREHLYDTTYNSYKNLQNKFVEYFNDNRPRSQIFEELLMSTVMILGSVDYLTSCLTLLKWKPKFQLSTTSSKKLNIFKSVLGHIIWDKLSSIDDINTIKCLVNSYLLKKDVYNTIMKLQAVH